MGFPNDAKGKGSSMRILTLLSARQGFLKISMVFMQRHFENMLPHLENINVWKFNHPNKCLKTIGSLTECIGNVHILSFLMRNSRLQILRLHNQMVYGLKITVSDQIKRDK